ncbi:MAG: hypothetical protein ACRENA_08785 [Vulcanimicrobiaceae bacterium]
MRVLLLSLCLVLAMAQSAPARPGYCEIELINSMNNDVSVHGTFDDGHPLTRFRMYAHETPHYISLHYSGYCHSGMRLTVESIQTPHNEVIYNAWTHKDATVRIVPYKKSK